ncbi:hypothetical protein [Pseudomonas rhodesiae]|uniref:Uncharacterized protein n=1 Tax=Pseudomonas rhodesiae TaxID=76760 RepID=A0AAE8L100_9PSED|nr:hypothetical protein [Pseudomonas rhodesiae]TWR54597.1 hypothetical protein FIV35_14880 [Pseudomonas rhodesiae]SDV13880.1 hypothetical protein SAMN04490209_4178 [Pseudomonas rhodesiae]
MFQTNSDDALSVAGCHDGNKKNWHCVSHPIGMPWFYVREHLPADNFLGSPTSKMIMTSSIGGLDRTLSGKNKGRRIEKIQLITACIDDSPLKPDSQLGVVTRITRFNSGRGEAPRYLVESTEGIVLDGPLDGAWGRCKQKVLMDVFNSGSHATASTDEDRTTREVQKNVIIQTVDLFQDNVGKACEWWARKNPQLGNKAPKDLITEEEYLLLADLVGRIERNALI